MLSLSPNSLSTNPQTHKRPPLMAVEARHLNLYPVVQANGASAYNEKHMGFFGVPSAAALPENQFFNLPTVCDSMQAKTSVNTDSGLTYNMPVHRKRSSEAYDQYETAPPLKSNATGLSHQLPSLVGDDFMPQILQQYQFEIDSIISQHTKKIRLELEERQKQQARLLAAAIGEGVMKKLKEKDEQIQRMEKLNLVLQERAKSLYVENQLWRDLAQTNEATANSLRTNLEQVLQHVGGDERVSAVEEDVESCCDGGRDAEAQDKDEGSSHWFSERRCRMCRERESCVLLLPCRHLCLCNVCGSGSQQLQSCPVCHSSVTATLHVNIS